MYVEKIKNFQKISNKFIKWCGNFFLNEGFSELKYTVKNVRLWCKN